MASPSVPPVTRRRQRSIRLSLAVALLALAGLVVTGALLSGSWVPLAAVAAVVLGAAATRITHAELAQTRRDAARDRATQAQDYRDLTVARTLENRAFAEFMTERVTRREQTLYEVRQALAAARGQAAEAARARDDEARRASAAEREGLALASRLDQAETRAAEAIVSVVELEHQLDLVRAELDVVTAAWRAGEATRRRA